MLMASLLLFCRWEFPNVLVSSAPPPKAKRAKGAAKNAAAAEAKEGGPDALPEERSSALDAALTQLLRSDASAAAAAGSGAAVAREAAGQARAALDGPPVVHVFSSVTHTMHIELGTLPPPANGQAPDAERWQAGNNRWVAWMREEDMAAVGLTTNMRKVLAAVQAPPSKKRRK